MLDTPPSSTAQPSIAAEPVDATSGGDAWIDLAHRRLADVLAGFERWRRAWAQEDDAHAALKLRAHARRIERFAAAFAPEVERSHAREEILAIAQLAAEVLVATTPLRAHDLATDYFDGVQRGLGDSRAAVAAGKYSDWLFEAERPAVIVETRAALRALSLKPATRARKALAEASAEQSPLPPLGEAIERVRAAAAAAWRGVEPLVCGFDQSVLAEARSLVRTLRYTWKALRPCFGAEVYTLNHDHAHRLQSLLGQAGDIELWVRAAEPFADHPAARRKGVRPQDWDRVLRYVWAQRLNLLHQVGRHALVRRWLEQAGARADMLRPLRPDLKQR